jgi:hypothetical protein
MAGKFFNKNLQNILSPVHARAAETIDMQDVPILSFDFARAFEAHAAAKGHKRQKEDTMQEVPILSYDFSAASSSSFVGGETPSQMPSEGNRASVGGKISSLGGETPSFGGKTPREEQTCETLSALLDTQCQERIAASEATQIASQETFDSQDTYNEDPDYYDRKIAKCVDWWQGEQFTKSVWGTHGLLGDDLLCEDWLNIDCYRSQKYDGQNVERATEIAIQFAFDVVRGRNFKIGITADIKHRWTRPDIDKFGNAVGYMHNGYRKMYIVHVSDYGKADLSIEKFEKDPELQRQMKANDRSAGRMEMQMVLAVRHLSGCQNTGPGNEAATNKNGVTAVYIVVD